MTEVDRTNMLHDLNSRHEEVLSELDALSRSIEGVLAKVRPPGVEAAAAATAAGPSGPIC
jgi:hypothetical protein